MDAFHVLALQSGRHCINTNFDNKKSDVYWFTSSTTEVQSLLAGTATGRGGGRGGGEGWGNAERWGATTTVKLAFYKYCGSRFDSE